MGWDELKKGEVEISQVFIFEREDLIDEPSEAQLQDLEDFTYRFHLARGGRSYYRIEGRKLGIENDVRIAKNGVNWRRKLFAAERNISIFKRIAKLIPPAQKIFLQVIKQHDCCKNGSREDQRNG